MKKIIYTTFGICFLALIACNKVKVDTKAVIIRDCTGVYLQINGKDYHVCNSEKTASYADGSKVTVAFNKIADCEQTGIVCYMLHENEGWIEIKKIEP